MGFTEAYIAWTCFPDIYNIARKKASTLLPDHIAPDYLSSLIPRKSKPYRNTISEMHKIFEILAPEQLNTMNHFYHRRYLRQWNNLQIETRQCDSLNSFKRVLNKDKQYAPKYYYFGKRKAQVLHTRLRTGCSSLKVARDSFVLVPEDFKDILA